MFFTWTEWSLIFFTIGTCILRTDLVPSQLAVKFISSQTCTVDQIMQVAVVGPIV